MKKKNDNELPHSFIINQEKCRGSLECLKICPTQAIRVKEGKATLISQLCIDCGWCLRVCPSKAISATTLTFEDLEKFKFKVAVPSSVLFSQFPMDVSPQDIGEALLSLGFDAVWDLSIEIELVSRAIQDFIKNWKGPFPLISSGCPVVIRLIQVSYPTIVKQIVPIEPPRELAGKEAKMKYSKELGLKEDEIAAIYITPCQAKTISILQPAEEGKSYLDGAIGISDIYNEIQTYLHTHKSEGNTSKKVSYSNKIVRWSIPGGSTDKLGDYNYLNVTGMRNIINILDDIEKGRIENLEYLECYACQGGCIGGNLTVDNLYLARSKTLKLLAQHTQDSEEWKKEVERRYKNKNFYIKGILKPRKSRKSAESIIEKVNRKKKADEILKKLPGINCCLCGAPTCECLAHDIALGEATIEDCIFFSKDRLNKLKNIYGIKDNE